MSGFVPRDVKLLATSNRGYELDAASEVWHCLRATKVAGDAQVIFFKRGKVWLRGLIAFSFAGDPINAVERIREYLEKRPWIMEFTHRIIPVEAVCYSLDELKEVVSSLGRKIGEEDKWAVRVSKHDTIYKRSHIIEAAASAINKGKVDLRNPDWIVNIEAVRDSLLVAVIKEHHIIRKKDIAGQA